LEENKKRKKKKKKKYEKRIVSRLSLQEVADRIWAL